MSENEAAGLHTGVDFLLLPTGREGELTCSLCPVGPFRNLISARAHVLREHPCKLVTAARERVALLTGDAAPARGGRPRFVPASALPLGLLLGMARAARAEAALHPEYGRGVVGSRPVLAVGDAFEMPAPPFGERAADALIEVPGLSGGPFRSAVCDFSDESLDAVRAHLEVEHTAEVMDAPRPAGRSRYDVPAFVNEGLSKHALFGMARADRHIRPPSRPGDPFVSLLCTFTDKGLPEVRRHVERSHAEHVAGFDVSDAPGRPGAPQRVEAAPGFPGDATNRLFHESAANVAATPGDRAAGWRIPGDTWRGVAGRARREAMAEDDQHLTRDAAFGEHPADKYVADDPTAVEYRWGCAACGRGFTAKTLPAIRAHVASAHNALMGDDAEYEALAARYRLRPADKVVELAAAQTISLAEYYRWEVTLDKLLARHGFPTAPGKDLLARVHMLAQQNEDLCEMVNRIEGALSGHGITPRFEHEGTLPRVRRALLELGRERQRAEEAERAFEETVAELGTTVDELHVALDSAGTPRGDGLSVMQRINALGGEHRRLVRDEAEQRRHYSESTQRMHEALDAAGAPKSVGGRNPTVQERIEALAAERKSVGGSATEMHALLDEARAEGGPHLTVTERLAVLASDRDAGARTDAGRIFVLAVAAAILNDRLLKAGVALSMPKTLDGREDTTAVVNSLREVREGGCVGCGRAAPEVKVYVPAARCVACEDAIITQALTDTARREPAATAEELHRALDVAGAPRCVGRDTEPTVLMRVRAWGAEIDEDAAERVALRAVALILHERARYAEAIIKGSNIPAPAGARRRINTNRPATGNPACAGCQRPSVEVRVFASSGFCEDCEDKAIEEALKTAEQPKA